MELTLFQVITLLISGGLFGLVGKELTKDEKEIYKKKIYFPLFQLVLAITAISFLFIDKNLTYVFLSLLIMMITWSIKPIKKTRK